MPRPVAGQDPFEGEVEEANRVGPRRFVQQYRAVIEEGVGDGSFRPVDPSVAAQTMVEGIRGVARLLTGPIWGVLSDRLGRKLMLLRALYLATPTTLIAALIGAPWQISIALAFQAHGTSFTHGLAAGIAFHAVETAVGLMFGLASLVWLAPYPTPGVRRVALLATAASWSVGIAGAFSATVLVPLV